MMRAHHPRPISALTEPRCHSCACSRHSTRQTLRQITSPAMLTRSADREPGIHHKAVNRVNTPLTRPATAYTAQQTIKTHTAR